MQEKITDSRIFRKFVIIDEYSREYLTLLVRPQDVIECLYRLFSLRGVPEHIRSGNGPEIAAEILMF